jgi:hypothetical protein
MGKGPGQFSGPGLSLSDTGISFSVQREPDNSPRLRQGSRQEWPRAIALALFYPALADEEQPQGHGPNEAGSAARGGNLFGGITLVSIRTSKIAGLPMGRSVKFLLAQIERAKRFAAAMTKSSDREAFEIAADEYQRELDALRAAEGGSSSSETKSATPPSEAVASVDEPNRTASSDASVATNDDAITSNNTGKRETD